MSMKVMNDGLTSRKHYLANMRICESYACRPCQELEDKERQLSDAIEYVGHIRRTIISLKSDANAAHDRVIAIELISRVFRFCMPDDEPQPLDRHLGDSTPWISCFPQRLSRLTMAGNGMVDPPDLERHTFAASF